MSDEKTINLDSVARALLCLDNDLSPEDREWVEELRKRVRFWRRVTAGTLEPEFPVKPVEVPRFGTLTPPVTPRENQVILEVDGQPIPAPMNWSDGMLWQVILSGHFPEAESKVVG